MPIADEYSIAKAYSVDELSETTPKWRWGSTSPCRQAHGHIMLQARSRQKRYNEKARLTRGPRRKRRKRAPVAKEKGLARGQRARQFSGRRNSNCRKLIDDGAIGQPIAASAFMLCRGHESWHPSPEFYYKLGGGPMFDMGPYYLTALVNLIGPVRRVTGSARVSFPQRTITSEPLNGTVIDVEVPTHVAGVMDFENGAIGTIIQSFDVSGHSLPNIQIHGSEGSLWVPDPNGFGGTVRLYRNGEWEEVPLTHGYTGGARGIGMADMAQAMNNNRPHRANDAWPTTYST
jgi:hypothetical protein